MTTSDEHSSTVIEDADRANAGSSEQPGSTLI